jgi:hypothetical protein
MGTNFYWIERAPEKCETCGHVDEAERLHIGKSSAGWAFSLRIHPELDIRGLDDWIARFYRDGSEIRDEYDKHVPAEAMVTKIAGRGSTQPHRPLSRHNHLGTQPGPGTWDLCNYEFS